MESPSEEEASEEEVGESESGSDSDDFDSDDERVNMIPSQPTEQSASPTATNSAKVESSSESDGDDNPTMVDKGQPVSASQQTSFGTFDSDSDSEYDTESSSHSDESTHKAVQERVAEAVEAPRTSKKKLQEPETKSAALENGENAEKAKKKSVVHQKKDPAHSESVKCKVLENVQGSQTLRNGHGTVFDMVSDESVRNDKSGISTKKRKLDLLQNDTGRGLVGSTPLLKKSREADVDMKKAVKQKVLKNPRDAGMNESVAINQVADQDKPTHDVAKELAKKTLNSLNTRENRSTVSVDVRSLATGQKVINQSPSSSRQKRVPHVWSTDEEIVMACEILKHSEMGLPVPSKKSDYFWASLSEALQEKLGIEFSKEQLCEKARRLKQKYQSTLEKIEESQVSIKAFKHKNSAEKHLFDVICKIWGSSEISILEDEPGGENSNKQLNAYIQTSEGKGKQSNLGSLKAVISAKIVADKIAEGTFVDNSVDTNVNAIFATSTKPEQGQASKVDQRRDIHHTLANGSTLLSNNVDRVLQEEIHATLEDLQEWTKQTLEKWTTKTYALIEKSSKRLEEEVHHASRMSVIGGALPSSFSNLKEIQLTQGENDNQKKWRELRLQELNVYAQRLELMRLECELKQEQIKVHLQGAHF